jgi:hypothetical protein
MDNFNNIIIQKLLKVKTHLKMKKQVPDVERIFITERELLPRI